MTLTELLGLLKSATTAEEIDSKRSEIARLMPTVSIMFGFDQQNHAHQYDLWMHCVHCTIGLPRGLNDDMLYLAALLHDIGKPDTQTLDMKNGKINMHYYGHQIRSMEIVRDNIIPELNSNGEFLSDDEIRRLLYYVEYHDERVELDKSFIRKHLAIPVSLQEFQYLMLLEVADARAHVLLPIIQRRIRICQQLAGHYSEILYRELVSEKIVQVVR